MRVRNWPGTTGACSPRIGVHNDEQSFGQPRAEFTARPFDKGTRDRRTRQFGGSLMDHLLHFHMLSAIIVTKSR